MRIISIKSEDTDLSFSIGRHGENKTTAVIFDFSSWVNEFGDGVVTCLVRRFLDKIAYPVILRVEDNCATWIVTSTDTAYVGAGQVEFTYTIGDQIVKSVVYKTSVLGDIGTPPVSPSEPYKDFLDALTEIEANTFKNAQDAQDAANEIVDMTVSAETLEAGSEATVEKTIVDNVVNLNFGIPRGESGGGAITNDIKQALLNIFQVVAYTVSNPQDYYNALEDAFYPKTLLSISATFTQGDNIIYDTDSLDELKQYLVVVANYDDNSSEIVNNYTLSGTLQTGISTITVVYENKTTAFDVVVTHAVGTFSIANSLIGCVTSNLATFVTEEEPYLATITASAGYTLDGAEVEITMNEVDITSSVYSNGIITIPSVTGNLIITVTATVVALSSISAVYTQSKTVYTTDTLNSLKSDLVVTAHYSDSSEAEVTSANYELSGALTVGTSVITVTYQNKTTTFNVEVAEPVVLSSISAIYTQTSTIYPDTSLTDLKNDLIVTAIYSDSSTVSLLPNDYALSGTLVVGTSTILVSYINKTTTFNVIVSERPTLDSIAAIYTQTGVVEEDTPLNDLKADLVVTAYYSDNTSETVPSTDYALSGTLEVGTSAITVTYEGKTDTFNVVVSLLPSGYQQVEYIASNGSAHFEITNLNYPVGTVYKVKMLQTQRDTDNNRVAVGGLTTDNKYLCIGYKKDVNNVGGFHYWDGCWVTLTKAYTEPSIVTMTSTYSSISVTAENTTESQSNTVSTREAVQNVGRLGVFWDNRETNAFVGRIYDVEVKNGNTTLSHFVPCYKISDNKIGMYETISGAFYTSNTSTSFTKGDNV